MTHQFLPRAALIDICDTQQGRIQTLQRLLEEETQHKRRLEQQIVVLMGKLQEAKRQPLQETQ